MKNRKILIGILSLFIVATMVSGSLAIYQASIDDIDDSFEAAKFVIDSSTNGGFFAQTVNVAPGDVVTSKFVVKNHNENGDITETDMKLDIVVTLESGITPLTMKLFDGDKLLGTISNGAGTITWDSVDAVFTANVSADHTYTLVTEWPESANDIDYQGLSAEFSIKVTGSQVLNSTDENNVNQ